MQNFKREYYLKKIRAFVDKQLIKVLTGQRRVGKSYLLMQIRNEIIETKTDANIIYINFEKLEFLELKTLNRLAQYIQAKTKPTANYLFIDEVQEVEGFENLLRGLVSEPNFDIYVTGSNGKLLSGEIASYLSGRQIEIKIKSLSFPEFLEFYKLEPNKQSLDLFLRYGGMPYLHNLPHNELKEEYLRNILNTIIYLSLIHI